MFHSSAQKQNYHRINSMCWLYFLLTGMFCRIYISIIHHKKQYHYYDKYNILFVFLNGRKTCF